MARQGGYWAASNERYLTPEGGEPTEYRMRFELAPDGFTMAGCMWFDEEGPEASVLWRFFSAWDPTRSSMLAYQIAPWGGAAVGEQMWVEGDALESIQVVKYPGEPETRSRHLNRVVDENTLDSRSFDADGADWIPRRSYTWVWRPSAGPAPC